MARNNRLKKSTLTRNGHYKRSRAEIELDGVFIAECLVQGYTSAKIIMAKLNKKRKYNLSISSIQRDIRLIRREWAIARNKAYEGFLAEELAKIAYREQRAWEQFNESVKLLKLGDTSYLHVIKDCANQRMEILGMKNNTINNLTVVQQNMVTKRELYSNITELQALSDSELLSVFSGQLEDIKTVEKEGKNFKTIKGVVNAK